MLGFWKKKYACNILQYVIELNEIYIVNCLIKFQMYTMCLLSFGENSDSTKIINYAFWKKENKNS